MRYNEKIAGYDGLARLGQKLNRHITDKNGRAQFCTCMRSIWRNRSFRGVIKRCPASMREVRNSRKNRLDQWYREWVFERNSMAIQSRREQREVECAEYLSHLSKDSANWDEWKRGAICKMHFEESASTWLMDVKSE